MKKAKELSDSLVYRKKSVFETKNEKEIKKIFSFSKEYASWLDNSKTEREAVVNSTALLEKAGFCEYKFGDKVSAGGRYYLNNRNKSLIAFTIGKESLENGVRIMASHIDSPCLDLKQLPVFEKDGVGYLKTHYYGGIKKYQWCTIPLSVHGVVTKRNGEKVRVVIGEDKDDPVLYISDLLPHLSKDQNQKKLSEAFEGESLNLIACTSPYGDGEEVEDSVKLNLLRLLNEKYGIVESDLISSELTAVPAAKSSDVGLDRWLIGAYGHDDKCCAYPSLRAFIDAADKTEHTNIIVLADKEETGSNGVTGMRSEILTDLIGCISSSFGFCPSLVRSRSKCLSADVSAAYDPSFAEVYEKKNSALVHHGVALNKFTGSRGKYDTNDAPCEYTSEICALLTDAGVNWQMAELGKTDAGGGGTVAKYISEKNIDTIDIGVPVISMHAPYELISKADLYSAYEAFLAFCR